ncbi:MAG TPA: hypothetical protein PKL75_05285 [Treponemataceae bacterium]|nr:hypothetical protein [Treponemataceae bacterium]
MNKLQSLALIVTVAALPALFASCGATQWKETGRTAKTAEKAYTGMFYDDTNGIAVGYSGLARYTADGGKSWNTAGNSSMCLFACTMIDAANFVVAGNGNNVRTSKNSGKSWDAATNIVGKGKSLSFIDPSRGWGSSKTWIGETGDGCATWTPIPLPAGTIAETVCMLAPGSGYMVSQKGELFLTSDSGQHWASVSSPFPADAKDFTPSYKKDNQAVCLRMSGSTGIIAAIGMAGKTPALRIKTTTDGGKTWTKAETHPLAVAGMTVSISPTEFISVFSNDTAITKFSR